MYKRAVVPVYDDDYNYMIGCSGRSTNGQQPKWKHSKDFQATNYLYNLWFAKPHIQKSHVAILVEGPGDVWRLEENGIHNSLALFGCQLSRSQEQILNTLGILSIIILMDSDDAGKNACQKLYNKLHSLYRIFVPGIKKNDIGDMFTDEITRDIQPFIDSIINISKDYALCDTL